VRAHLHLLSRLGFVLRDPAFREALKRVASREELMESLSCAEKTIPSAE
jgi:nitrogen PTS system EIIA component